MIRSMIPFDSFKLKNICIQDCVEEVHLIEFVLPTIVVIPLGTLNETVDQECLMNPIESRLFQFWLVWLWSNVKLMIDVPTNQVRDQITFLLKMS